MPLKNHKKDKSRSVRHNSGQTILEVVIALILIILFLSGIVVVQLYAIRNADYAKNKSMATILARQQLERARVMRDSVGISVLKASCFIPLKCYIDDQLTPWPAPTGTDIYRQSLFLTSDRSCPTPAIISTPPPQSYKATAVVSWAQDILITPPPEVSIFSCVTDWR